MKILFGLLLLLSISDTCFAQQQYVLYPNQYVTYPYIYTQPTYVINRYETYYPQVYPYYYQYNYSYANGYTIAYPQVILNYDDRFINSYPVYRVAPRRFFNYSHFYRY
jgi:hypothetical protein